MLEWGKHILWLIKHVIYIFNHIWIILWVVDLIILVIPRINLFCGLFNGMYMGENIQPNKCNWSLILFPWDTIVIYFSLFGIWKVQLETRYIAAKLANSFWIRIFVFRKRWMYNHMLCYWCFNCVVEFYFPYMYLNLCVPWKLVLLVWLNYGQYLLTNWIDWTWNILRLCTRI